LGMVPVFSFLFSVIFKPKTLTPEGGGNRPARRSS